MQDNSFNAFRSLMQPGCNDRAAADDICMGCPHHRSDWKYRFCEYVECPKIKGFLTYREEFYGRWR